MDPAFDYDDCANGEDKLVFFMNIASLSTSDQKLVYGV